MEQYKMVDASTASQGITIRQGKYYTKIHDKHVESYGEYGAANIRDNITNTFREAMLQLNSTNISNNMLLVGKVQSGKTSNLELFTALAFDNGFNLVVIYGGYDNTLLSQTTNRFKKLLIFQMTQIIQVIRQLFFRLMIVHSCLLLMTR